MAFEIPVQSELSAFSEVIQLTQQVFKVGFSWNERGEFWTLDLATEDDVAIVVGTKIVAGIDLLGRFVDVRLPAGKLVAVDMSGAGKPPGRFELGERVKLVFVPHEELE